MESTNPSPTPTERERGLNQDREREITGVGGPAFYLACYENPSASSFLQERERERGVLSFSALVVVLKTSRQLARSDNEICPVPVYGEM